MIKRWIKNLKNSVTNLSIEKLSLVAIYDTIFYLAAFVVAMLVAAYIKYRSDLVPDFDMASDIYNMAKLEVTIKAMSSFMLILIIMIILYVVLFTILFGAAQCLIWGRLMEKELSFKSLRRYVYLSAIWMISSVIVILGGSLMMRKEIQPIAFIILMALFLHITPIIYIISTRENKIRHSLKTGIVVAFKKFHRFILQYILIIGVYVVIGALLLFRLISLIPNNWIVQGITFILTMLYMVWVRSYLIEIVKDVMGYR